MEEYQVVLVSIPMPKKPTRKGAPVTLLPVRRKLVVVGNCSSGKRTLLSVFRTGGYEDNRFTYLIENVIVDTEIDGQPVEIALWWTGAMEEYDRLRPLSYMNANVVLVCFGVDNPDSFRNVKDKWVPEVSSFAKGVPIVLVGCKTDLRDDPPVIAELAKLGSQPVSSEEAERLAQELELRYYECSCLQNEGVTEVFQAAVRASLAHRNAMKKGKCILI